MATVTLNAKYVSNSSYTGLIDGGSDGGTLSKSTTEEFLTYLLIDPDTINSIDSRCIINSITVDYQAKTGLGSASPRGFTFNAYYVSGGNCFYRIG